MFRNAAIAVLFSCMLFAAAAYEQAPSPVRARQLAQLSRRRSALLKQLSVHQSRASDAARVRESYQSSVAKFEKLLSATESACKSDDKACLHIDTVRAKLSSLHGKLRAARELEANGADEQRIADVRNQLAEVEHRLESVKAIYYGLPSVLPRPVVTFPGGRPQIVVPRPVIPPIVIQKPVIPKPVIQVGY